MPQSQRSSTKKITWSQVKTRVGLLAVLLVLCIVVVVPGRVNQVINTINQKANIGIPRLPDKGFNLGLDLQGGAHLVYHAKTDQLAASDKADAVQGVRDVIERRVRGGLGVSEPLVQTTQVAGDYRIIVELPGVTDVNQAIAMIGATPILEFKEQNDQPQRSLTSDEQKQLNDFNISAQKKAEEALADAKKGTDFATLFQKYSQPSTSTGAAVTTTSADLGFIDEREYPELYQWAQTQKDGDISKDLVSTKEGLNVVKLLGSEDGDEVVSADHILICYKGSTGCTATTTKEEALQKIQDIRKQVTPQNFTELAKKYSTDPTAQQNSGDLGFFRKGAMVQPFDDTVWKMTTSTISEPILTDFGYHIIYKKAQFKMKKYHIERVAIATKTAQDILPLADEWKSTGLSGKNLKKAEVVQDPQTGAIQVSLNFDEEGSKLFADLTGRSVGKRIAIFLDGKILTAPNVDRAITEGRAVITGGFDVTGARELAQNLNAGALPVPVELLSQQKVDATLGAASLNMSFMAGIYGLIAIMLFMILYYRLPGLLSVISLAFYAILSLAVFKVAGVTLTLSGIAGFILSIGMAVDANILVFERLKEELQAGKSFHASLEESFLRSWPSIRDGHITALISCVFLMWFGSGFVQGFAVILALGTIINLFTSITITRTFMRLCFKRVSEKANVLFLGYTKSKE